jgi:hypothetical protein
LSDQANTKNMNKRKSGTENKELILSLIKDDLINTKLVHGLNEAGLNAEHYFLHLGETIFKLMGFEDNVETEELFRHYMRLTEKAKYLDISGSHKPMDELAAGIYKELLAAGRN